MKYLDEPGNARATDKAIKPNPITPTNNEASNEERYTMSNASEYLCVENRASEKDNSLQDWLNSESAIYKQLGD